MLVRVCGGDLAAEACFAFGDDGVAKANDINAQFEEAWRFELLGKPEEGEAVLRQARELGALIPFAP